MLDPKLQTLVKKNKALFRDCSVYNLNEEAVVERFLNYAEIEDIKQMINIIGYDKTRSIFKKQITGTRINYISPMVINYFSLFFKLKDELSTVFGNIIERAKSNSFFYREV